METSKKFTEIKIGDEFYLPNYVAGFNTPFCKINDNMYYDLYSKHIYYATEKLVVNQINQENETLQES